MALVPVPSRSALSTVARAAKAVVATTLDALLPPRCLSCGTPVERQGGLCAACWGTLTFIAQPCCARCGLPFEYALEGESADAALCGACMADPPEFHRARAALVYDDGSRPLVLGFKHGDRLHAADAFGAWMARAGAELLADADLLAPVPLHRWRLFRRRYNQAALLAYAVGRRIGRPVAPDLLTRARATRSQGGLGRKERHRNVKGAFAPARGAEAKVRDKRIVLVDDVLTTGATLEECARVLRRAGAARVDVLTLARVVKT